MRFGVELPVEGSIVDWDVDEILERGSSEVKPEEGWGWETWEECMEAKRRDFYYDELKSAIARDGFTAPLAAYTAAGELRLADGHHRITVAVELGLEAVPVKVFYSWEDGISNDSGLWGYGR